MDEEKVIATVAVALETCKYKKVERCSGTRTSDVVYDKFIIPVEGHRAQETMVP